MKRRELAQLEQYMLSCMQDSAHDKDHVYRVLYTALDIAAHESGVDLEVLIVACLLHDIGRKEQFEDPALCHAAAGAGKARKFLLDQGYPAAFAEKVAACIRAHRFRSENQPAAIEEKILFDADKLDVTGTLGIARTLLYAGRVGKRLYTLDGHGSVSDGARDPAPSFFQEYKFKLEGLYGKFYTAWGKTLARQRQAAAVAFYESMRQELAASYETGRERLAAALRE